MGVFFTEGKESSGNEAGDGTSYFVSRDGDVKNLLIIFKKRERLSAKDLFEIIKKEFPKINRKKLAIIGLNNGGPCICITCPDFYKSR